MAIEPGQIIKNRELAKKRETLKGKAERYNTTIDMLLRKRWKEGEEALIKFAELPRSRDGLGIHDLGEAAAENYRKAGWKVVIDWKNEQFSFTYKAG